MIAAVVALWTKTAAADEACTAAEEMACVGNGTIDQLPMTDIASYMGEEGGLFAGGTNEAPEDLACAGLDAAAEIQPLDADGLPDPEGGRIVLFSIGMSNTTQEFSTFQQEQFNPSGETNPQLLAVDGAQGGHDARLWAPPNPEAMSTWDDALARLTDPAFGGEAGVTAEQVQVIWMKQALANPQSEGGFPEHAVALQDELDAILDEAGSRFPNLKIVYLSSRTSSYVLYPDDGMGLLNAEPFAFESGYSVKWLIEARRGGDGPHVTWGPYIWAHSDCNDQGFRWCCNYTGPDFTHPSPAGRSAVGEALMTFFSTDATAAPWFLADGPAVTPCDPGGGSTGGGESTGSGGGDADADADTGADADGDGDGDGGSTTSPGGSTGPASASAAEGGSSGGDGGEADGDGDAGCGCRSTGGRGGWFLLLLPLIVGGRARRFLSGRRG